MPRVRLHTKLQDTIHINWPLIILGIYLSLFRLCYYNVIVKELQHIVIVSFMSLAIRLEQIQLCTRRFGTENADVNVFPDFPVLIHLTEILYYLH